MEEVTNGTNEHKHTKINEYLIGHYTRNVKTNIKRMLDENKYHRQHSTGKWKEKEENRRSLEWWTKEVKRDMMRRAL